jgi:hypothetical protein
MDDLLRWSIGTAVVVALVTFILRFLTNSLAVGLGLTAVITLFSIIRAMQKYGLPDSAFHDGGVIALSAVAGLLIVQTFGRNDILEFAVTLVLCVIAYLLGGLVAKVIMRRHEAPEHPSE